MAVDLRVLCQKLSDLDAEETVDSSEVNPYLLNEVLRLIQNGIALRYGDIDYSEFDPDDIRVLAYYCKTCDQVSYQLNETIKKIIKIPPAASVTRAFC